MSAGVLTLDGNIASNSFSEVFLRALEATTTQPLQNNLIQSSDFEAGSEWLFDVAEAIGNLNQEFSDVTFEVDEERVSLSGVLSSENEKNRVFAALQKAKGIEWNPAASDVQVVVPVSPSLRIQVEAEKLSVSGEIADSQREPLSIALSETESSERELLVSTQDDLKYVERGYALPIVPQLPQALVFLTGRMSVVDILATVDTLEVSGIYITNTQTSLFELENELRDQLTLQLAEQIDQGMVLELSSIDWQIAEISANEDTQNENAQLPANGGNASEQDSDAESILSEELRPVVEQMQTEFSDFEFDDTSAELNEEQLLILDQLFDTMFLYENLRVTIDVNAFDFDTATQNLTISNQRADAISDYLTGLGLEFHKFRVVGQGDSLQTSGGSGNSGITLSFRQI